MMNIVLLAYYRRRPPIHQLSLDSKGDLNPDPEILQCHPQGSFTLVSVSPPSSPPSSPRSRSPEPLVLHEDALVHRIRMDPIHCCALLSLIERNDVFRSSFHNFWSSLAAGSSESTHCRDLILRMRMPRPVVKMIDYNSCYVANKTLWEYIELDDALHWLSTLGGAFSNLGEHSQEFAVRAGENALKQLIVAQQFGDKTVIAKCWLFIAMSRMQQKDFQRAGQIIRNVYRQTQRPELREIAGTGKLVSMCKGIWARHVYEYRNHRYSRKGNIEVESKFELPPDCRTRLDLAGAVRTGSAQLTDVYLDTRDLVLLSRDYWLRSRDGQMELKYPDAIIDHRSGNTVYREETDLTEIEKTIGCAVPTSVCDLPPDWRTLASVQTKREMWRLDGMSIVLDELQDGFALGEIELVVFHHSQVAEAQSRIDKLAESLGFIKQWEGKLDHCLRTQNPEAFEILKKLHCKKC